MSSNYLWDSDSTDSESMPEVKMNEGQFVVGKTYHWGKLQSEIIGSKTIFKDVSEGVVKKKCSLIVIMQHDETKKHPSLPPEWKVQKKLLKKIMLTQEFVNSWSTRDALTIEFAKAVDQLPSVIRPEKLECFKSFFEKFGHGFLKSGYLGGEVYLQILDETFDCVYTDSEDDPLLNMNVDKFLFKGGNSIYHNPKHLEEWRESLYDSPVELILDHELDVVFYHDFVPTLTWLKNGRARGQALKEALMALEEINHGNKVDLKGKDDRGLMTHPAPPESANSKHPIFGDSAYLSINHSSIRMKGASRSGVGTCLVGKGFNVFKMLDAYAVLRPEKIGNSVSHVEMISVKMVKLHDKVGGTDDNINVGLDSFALKVVRSRHTLTHIQDHFGKEFAFSSLFRAMLNSLPNRFSYTKVEIFKSFFKMFGHAVLLKTHQGGQVCFRLANEDKEEASEASSCSSQEVLSALSASVSDDLRKDLRLCSEGKQRYLVGFDGGEDELKRLDKLQEWIVSLNTSPCHILYDWDKDVMPHHDLVRQLFWIKDNTRTMKAKALEEAFTCLHLHPNEQGER